MSLKIQIQNIVNKLEDIDDRAFRNLILVSEEIRNNMRDTAPLGITGRLKDSFRTVIYDSILDPSIQIVSNASYAKKQDIEKLRHVPEADLGKKSFRDYAKRSKNKKVTSGSRQNRYEQGYRMAVAQEMPSEIYVTHYAQKAIDSVGGIDSIKKRVLD